MEDIPSISLIEYLGATWTWTFTETDDETGSPVSNLGNVVWFQLRDNKTDAMVMEFSTTNGKITTGGVLGTTTLSVASMSSVDVATALPIGAYHGDVCYSNGGGFEPRFIINLLVIKKDTR